MSHKIPTILKRTDNQQKFDALREEFSTLTFERQTVRLENGTLSLAFDFNLDDRYHFSPTLEIPSRPFFDWDGLPKDRLEALAFQIGMTELVSYWKIACPKKVVVKPFALTERQISFWKKLYYNGLGEFLYLNGITVSEAELMRIETLPIDSNRTVAARNDMDSSWFEEKTLVPIGGGKDSVVTLECLRGKMPVIPLIVNPRGATLNCVKTAGYKENDYIVINRTLDPTMLKLNAEGYLNGHTPFSALLAFISVLVAFGSRSRYIALSNENSANEATVPGTNINHQYSKSIEFERDFRSYVAENLSEGERNFIAFLYFYHQVRGSMTSEELKEKIVVIDDPVSSMDSTALFLVSAIVREMINVCRNNTEYLNPKVPGDYIKQLFILTHNVYFHREVTYQQVGYYNCTSFYMIRKNDNISTIKHCTRQSKETPSEDENYNPVQNSYAALWDELRDLQSTIPALNVMRRILEYYFLQLCGYEGSDLRELVLENEDNRKKFIKQVEGQKPDMTDYQLASSLLAYINNPNGISDGLNYVEDCDDVDAYKRVFKMIFEVLQQSQHYQMMTGKTIMSKK